MNVNNFEAVLAHESNPKRYTSMAFQFKRVGNPEPTRIIWQNMREKKALNDYLIANRLKNFGNRFFNRISIFKILKNPS